MTLHPSSSHLNEPRQPDSDSVFAQARAGAFRSFEDKAAAQAAEQDDAKQTAAPESDEGIGDIGSFFRSLLPTPDQIAQMRAEQRRQIKTELTQTIGATLENLSATVRIFAELTDDLFVDVEI